MCLEYVREKVAPTSLIQSGWKEFSGGYNTNKLSFQNFPFRGSQTVPMDQWLTAEGDGKVRGGDYKPGFHIYEDEKELDGRSRKRRVYYRRVHTRGTQDGLTVVIAQEMYVPTNPDAWPPKEEDAL